MENYLSRLRRRAVADIARQDCRELLDTLSKRLGRTTGGSEMRTVRAIINMARGHDETIAGMTAIFLTRDRSILMSAYCG